MLVTLAFHSLTTGFLEAVVLAFLAVGIVDFFFIDPLLSFTVSDPADAVALISFLLTSLIITRIQAKTRIERRNAESLYEVSKSLIALPSEETPGKEFLECICSAFGCEAVSIYDARLGITTSAGKQDPELDRETRERYISGLRAVHNKARIVTVCLEAQGKLNGAIGFSRLRSPEAAPSLAALAATGLDRAAAHRQARSQTLTAEAEVLRSAILDALGHEFKVPLATIMTAAGGLPSLGTLNERQTELADLIESEADRLSDVTTRLLRIARLDRDEVRPFMEAADLGGLTQTVVTPAEISLAKPRYSDPGDCSGPSHG